MGFDVIVGNPPYVEYSKITTEYKVKDYDTEGCGNLYAMVLERALHIQLRGGRCGFIVPISSFATSRMANLRKGLNREAANVWASHYAVRPSCLFEGVVQRLSIIIASTGNELDTINTTKYYRWSSDERQVLLQLVEYKNCINYSSPSIMAKVSDSRISHVLNRILNRTSTIVVAQLISPHGQGTINYQEATGYWVKAIHAIPYYRKNGQTMLPAHGRSMRFSDANHAKAIAAIMNSSLFFLYFASLSDGYHLSDGLVKELPVCKSILSEADVMHLGDELLKDLILKATRKRMETRTGDIIEYDEYISSKSKPIIDEIDRVLAKHYGFTPEETDFIINYDIKYRMGKGGGEEE